MDFEETHFSPNPASYGSRWKQSWFIGDEGSPRGELVTHNQLTSRGAGIERATLAKPAKRPTFRPAMKACHGVRKSWAEFRRSPKMFATNSSWLITVFPRKCQVLRGQFPNALGENPLEAINFGPHAPWFGTHFETLRASTRRRPCWKPWSMGRGPGQNNGRCWTLTTRRFKSWDIHISH